MFLFDVHESRRKTLLQAMYAVALADGALSPKERALLDASAAALGTTLELAATLRDDDLLALDTKERTRVVQSMVLMAIMDGAGSREESALISRVAKLLEVDDARVENLRQLAEGRVRFMRFDLTRRGYASAELAATFKEEGVGGIYRTFGPLLGLARDESVAAKYKAFGELAPGTVGRTYFDFITSSSLSFPGQADGIAERGMWHDMLHVIGGYTADPLGEAEVVAFMSGFRKEDPFFWLFTVALQFQVGLVISPFAPGVPDQIDPARFMRHLKRGALVNADLSTEWRFVDDWKRPLVDVQRQFNVVPFEAIS